MFSFVKNWFIAITRGDVLLIMMYELGHLAQNYWYSRTYTKPQAYLGDAKREMADLVSMCRLYCELSGWDFEEVLRLGEEHYMEKMDDYRKHGSPVIKDA